MKILLSPSKTKKLTGTPKQGVFNEALTKDIVAHIQQMDSAVFAKALKLKGDKGTEWFEFYQHFDDEPVGTAIESYSGLAFKNFDWQGLSDAGKTFGADHVYVMSALYGLVAPLSAITAYRLDFVDTIYKGTNTNLYEQWSKPVNEALANEDWLLNVASKEYSSIVEHPRMVTVEFLEEKDGTWRQLSTSSKQMRGRLAHYMVENQCTSWRDFPKELTGFVRDGELPDELTESITVSYKRQ